MAVSYSRPIEMARGRTRRARFDTGDVGEDHVQSWGSRGGFTVTPVRRDKKGWDFVFQKGSDDSALLELFAPELRCWVQVKSSIGTGRPPRISLANWRRMVLDPQPWFIVIVRLDSDGEVRSAHVLHVNDKRIEQILKILWKDEPKTESALARRSVSAVSTPEEVISAPYPRRPTRTHCRRYRRFQLLCGSKSYIPQQRGARRATLWGPGHTKRSAD
jgi:hypothetical protein